MTHETAGPRSDRTRVRRGAVNADYEPVTIRAVLDAGLVAHVGVVTDEGPIVIPMAFGRTDDDLFLHGAAANAALGAADGTDVCATVTIVDGLVVARAPFHNTMRYRSVVVRGRAHRLEGTEKVAALQVITDHVVPNWDTGRTPIEAELRATLVLAMPLTESSAKIREGGPNDEDADLTGPHWAGALPIVSRWGSPEPADDLAVGVEAPPAIAATEGRTLP